MDSVDKKTAARMSKTKPERDAIIFKEDIKEENQRRKCAITVQGRIR